MKNIALIGVGLMGHGIASNLLKHAPSMGHTLAVLEHPGNQPLEGLLQGGCKTFTDIPSLAAWADCVLMVVTGAPQVESIVLGDAGLAKHLRAGSTVIDCSTSLPETTKKVAVALQAKGIAFLDCPMTRTPKEAAEGRLNLLVGGDAALLAKCTPLLKCFAENIMHAGAVGAGHSMKLLHNYVSLGQVVLLAEAAAHARVAGIANDVFADILEKGGGFGAALNRLKPYILNDDTSGLKFALGNALKDLSYYNEMASASHADATVASAVKATLAQACEEADPHATLVPELISLLRKRAN